MPVALGVIEGHEYTEAGLDEADSRLAQWQVASWTIAVRRSCIQQMAQESSPYLPTFVVGCEVALVGLSLLPPEPGAGGVLYNTLFRRFIPEAFLPLLKRMETASDPRLRRDYQPLIQICRLCNSPALSASKRRWTSLESDMLQYRRANQPPEIAALHELISTTIFLAQYILTRPESPTPRAMMPKLIRALSVQHQWQLHGNLDSKSGYTHLTAQAFLTALETQCPAPDWIIPS